MLRRTRPRKGGLRLAQLASAADGRVISCYCSVLESLGRHHRSFCLFRHSLEQLG